MKADLDGTTLTELISPNTYFTEPPRNTQVNVRPTRTFQAGRTRFKPGLDI
jgi:hypothetical protein